MSNGSYDVVVLGGGPGGYAAALRAALLGQKVAIVERDKVGGTCLHRGCIPTKGLLHAAEVLDTIRDAKTYGITVNEPEFDWAAVQKSKSEPIKKLHSGLSSLIKARKIDLVNADGKLGPRGTIKAGDKDVTGRQVILAVGSYARYFPGMEPDGERVITSDHALTRETLPRSIAIIGAGAVGVEFASVYRSFGVDVTVIEALPRIVPLEDADVSKELTASFGKRGIAVHAGAKVQDIDRSKDLLKVTFSKGDKTASVDVEQVLVAVGRGPSTDGLDLDSWGIKSERGYILTDDTYLAGDGVWAVGDAVAMSPQFAHVAFAQGFSVAERIAGGTPVMLDYDRDVPHATYCNPEIASVGLTEEAARERGMDVEVHKHGFTGIAKAQILHQPRGFAKIVAEKGGRIVGLHIIGPRVTELLSEILLAVGWEAYPSELAGLVHPHPTLSEVVGEAALAAIGRPLHG
ncbi:MAG TPA: dihydrolipoyl dehydrogenase [Actinomycetota bacterium]|nr:dihydrolipoyl dehydrogenase [Actinomycetota bacterium]